MAIDVDSSESTQGGAGAATELAARRTGWIGWLPLAVLGLLPVLLVRGALVPVSDPDTFWHIRAGDYLWDTWQFSGPDPWSEFSTLPWVLHEWLPQLAMAGVYSLGGLPAIAWLNAVGVLGVAAALYWSCRSYSDVLPSLVATALAWLGASQSLSPRPQVLTFILLALTTAAWLRTIKDGRARWWLIPLTWLWASCHGMWFAGVALGGAVAVGLALEGAVDRRQAIRLLSIPALSVVAAALTPVGPQLLLAPFTVGDYTKYVTEWAPPSIQEPYMAITVAMIAVVVLTWARQGKRAPWPHILVLVVASGWALLYSRTVPLGAVMIAPLFAMSVQKAVKQPLQPRSNKERWLFWAGMAAALAVAAVVVPSTSSQPGKVPNTLNDELAALPAKTVVYNDYALGGWLLLRHPQLSPVVDGRTEVFDTDYLDSYFDSTAAGPKWEETVGRSRAAHALLPTRSPLGLALQDHLGWTVVGTDADYTLLKK